MKILLIRLRLIGDVVFTTPIPRAVKRAFPGARVSYLVEQAAAPVVSHNPHIDEVIVVRRRRGWRRVADDVALARRLRRARYDVVIDLHGGPRSSWLAWASGARQRIGYDVKGRSWMYTRTVGRPRELRARHSVVNQWDLLDALEGWPGTAPDPARDAVEMAPDPAVVGAIARRLAEAGIEDSHELVVAHVSAGNPFRRWPEPAFTEVLARIAETSDRRRVIVSSGPSDREAAARITAAARERLGAAGPRIVDFGEFGLAELRELIVRSRVFIGGDTGPLHIAGAVGTPLVALFGPTYPERNGPWSSRDVVISRVSECSCLYERRCRTSTPCINDITMQQAVDGVRRMLTSSGRS